jgi:hypothetical protein
MPIQDLVQELYAEQPGETLYHYTSLKGTIGIIESRSLWATDIRFFNDAAELKYTADRLQTTIAQRLEDGDSNARLLTQFQGWLSRRITDGHMLYVACFTANGNLLSQWRGYCPIGKGVSLGFHPEKIRSCAAEQYFLIGKCVYDVKTQHRLVASIIDTIERVAEEKGENADPSKRHPSQSFYDVFEEVEADLLRVAALLKHPSFHEEQEWRTVSPVTTNYVDAPIEIYASKCDGYVGRC